VTTDETVASAHIDPEHIEQLARWLHHHFDTEHLTWDAESEPGRDYYRKMARAQLAEVPFLAERLAKPVSTGDAALDHQIDTAAFEAGLQHLYEEARTMLARAIGLARDIGARQAEVDAEHTLERLRALVREHPESEVPVIELDQLRVILGMEP